MVRLLARVMGIGIETADMLVQEVLSRNLRDRRAVARYAGLTGSPDESGKRRREKGLARSGNPRVRRGIIELAWRFLMFQKDSVLAQWFRARTGRRTAHAGSRLKPLTTQEGHRLESQPSGRTGENPPYGMIGRIEETSASFGSPIPRACDPTSFSDYRTIGHPMLLARADEVIE